METNIQNNDTYENAVKNIATGQGYDPILGQAPDVKSYQRPNMSSENLPDDLPQASFAPVTNEFQSVQNPGSAATNPSDTSQPAQTFNPQLNDLSKTEKKIAAEMAAETAIEAYAMLWQKVLTPFAQFNEKQMQKEYVAGTIDPNLGVQVDSNTFISVKQYTKGFNESVEETLKVSDQFKENVRPPLIRIFEKRGIGMTDEQKLGWEVLQDFGVKAAMIISIRNDIKEVKEGFRDDSRKIQLANTPQAVKQENDTEITPANPAINETVNTSGLNEKDPGTPVEKITNADNGVVVAAQNMTIEPFVNKGVLDHMQNQSNAKVAATKSKTTKTPVSKSTVVKKQPASRPESKKATEKK